MIFEHEIGVLVGWILGLEKLFNGAKKSDLGAC
jgi:hypothetical protein